MGSWRFMICLACPLLFVPSPVLRGGSRRTGCDATSLLAPCPARELLREKRGLAAVRAEPTKLRAFRLASSRLHGDSGGRGEGSSSYQKKKKRKKKLDKTFPAPGQRKSQPRALCRVPGHQVCPTSCQGPPRARLGPAAAWQTSRSGPGPPRRLGPRGPGSAPRPEHGRGSRQGCPGPAVREVSRFLERAHSLVRAASG